MKLALSFTGTGQEAIALHLCLGGPVRVRRLTFLVRLLASFLPPSARRTLSHDYLSQATSRESL